MTIDGRNYRLTKHGRLRFLERVGPACLDDNEIIRRARVHPRAIWKPERWPDGTLKEALRLVTVLPDG
jgi:hypothetical protein